jgi:hypothetical protein
VTTEARNHPPGSELLLKAGSKTQLQENTCFQQKSAAELQIS